MNFDLTQKNFPSFTHKSIWHAALFLAPFQEVVPPNLSGEAAENLRQGERNLYQFMNDLYTAMCENPAEFYLPVGEYDRFMNGRPRKELNSYHGGDPKESRLRNQFQQAIQFYQKLLFEIGVHGMQVAGTEILQLDPAVFGAFITEHNLRILRGEVEKRATALLRLGLEIKWSKEQVTVACQGFPSLLTALTALCHSPERKFALTNFLRCDFRSLLSYQPGLSDAISILPAPQKKKALIMEGFMEGMKSTRGLNYKISVQPLRNITLDSPWKLAYTRNGKSVFGYHADPEGLVTFAYFNHPENIAKVGRQLKQVSPTLYGWFYEKMPTRTCACKNNRLVDIGGQAKRICGLMNRLDLPNPNEEDLQCLQRIIEIYLDLISS